MDGGRQEAARKLLELERRAQQGALDEGSLEAWGQAARELFGQNAGPHARRSVRLSAEAQCNVRAGQGSFPCVVVQASLVGLTLAGEVFRYLAPGTPLVIETFDDGERRYRLDLSCNVVRVDMHLEPPVAGVQFLPDVNESAWQRYFSQAYYPIYLGFLQGVARATTVKLSVDKVEALARKTKPKKQLAAKKKPAAKPTKKPAAKPTKKPAAKPKKKPAAKPKKKPAKGKKKR
jgi:hypothetical protein